MPRSLSGHDRADPFPGMSAKAEDARTPAGRGPRRTRLSLCAPRVVPGLMQLVRLNDPANFAFYALLGAGSDALTIDTGVRARATIDGVCSFASVERVSTAVTLDRVVSLAP